MKNRIYRIHIVGNKAWRCDLLVENIEQFRKETANTFKVNLDKVKFCYDSTEEWED